MSARRKRKGKGCLTAIVIWLIFMTVLGILAAIMLHQGIPQRWAQELGKKHSPIPFQASNISAEEVEKKYFYEMLTESEKVTYQEILQGIREYNTEIYIRETDLESIQKTIRYIMYDTPDIFWYDGSSTLITYEESFFGEAHTIVEVQYSASVEEIERQKQEIEAVVAECLRLAPEGGEYEKIKYVYDYIVDTVEYDLEAPNNQNIYSVFVGKRSVCAGYAKAFQYLMERMDIFATYVVGTTNTGPEESMMGHAWNLVHCDGEYYYVDVTWGDPLFEVTESEMSADEARKIMDATSYDYMLCTSEELFRTHQLGEGIIMPECVATINNYYRRNNMHYDEVDEQLFLQVLQNALATRSNPVVFKFSDEAVFMEAKTCIMEELVEIAARNHMSTHDLRELYYYHQVNDNQYKLVIEWVYE